LVATENHLIELLPHQDQLRLLSICEPVPLLASEVLADHRKPASHVYFPIEGFISLLTVMNGKPSLGVGMVGSEGMLGVQLALGNVLAPVHALVQEPGRAWRAESGAFQLALDRSPALQRNLNRYLYVLMSQWTMAAACQRFHSLRPRLARWLLMSQDRCHSDRFVVTHEFLAHMLGVRRVGVTMAAGDLQRNGLIEYHRGHVVVLDRQGLEAAACSCYAEDRSVYADTVA